MNIRTALRGAAPVVAFAAAGLALADAQDAPNSGPTLMRDATLDVKLWSRSIARLRTPAGVGPAILVDSEWLMASDRLVADVSPGAIEIVFDSVDDAPDTSATPQAWEASRVASVYVDGTAGFAFIQLRPRGDQTPGDSRSVLGGRGARLCAGESVRFISVDESGRKVWGRVDALCETATSNGASDFCWLAGAGVDSIGEGAPLLDAGGCLVGVTVHAAGQPARAIRVAALRASVPPDARSIGECRLPEELEENLNLPGDRGGNGLTSGGSTSPSLPATGGGGGGGGGGGLGLPNTSGIFAEPPGDFRDEPPNPPIDASPDVPPPPFFDNTRPRQPDDPPISFRRPGESPDSPDSPDRRGSPDWPVITPDPDTTKTPEPGTAGLLLIGAAIAARRRR